MMFHVGQKVVCVNDQFSSHWGKVPHMPRRGRIYTVRTMRLFDFSNAPGTYGVLLEEIVNPIMWWELHGRKWKAEVPFWVERFRPIAERKTDISIFTAMLTNAPKEFEITHAGGIGGDEGPVNG